MTAPHEYQRESIDLLERILERVETIDRNVEDLLDQVGNRLGDFTVRGYGEQDHDSGYE